MSEIDKKALQSHFQVWKAERAPTEEEGAAFERFTVDQILKDADLSDDEIDAGRFGGRDDGGVDALYFFVNRQLVQGDDEPPTTALTAELVIIQAKRDKGFSETALEKIAQFSRDLLDFDKSVDELTYLNPVARDIIASFRARFEAILGTLQSLDVRFYYAIDGDSTPGSKVLTRAENLKKQVKNVVSSAAVSVEFWACERLLKAAQSIPSKQFTINTTKHFATDEGAAAVCLARLKDFAIFLTDESGGPRRGILEPNVRAYQGEKNTVNSDIRRTLEGGDGKEFWWLNNGITILADNQHIAGSKLVMVRPQIVNGLQTSMEIFEYLSRSDRNDERNVLIRVVVPPDEATRNKIIQATNNQTAVPPVSLHAMDPLHFDIENKFKLYGLYYDRRKGEHRQARRPIADIVSMPALGKAVIAILLQKPNDARARPGNLLKVEEAYNQIFNPSYNRDLYVTCIMIDRRVQEFLKATGEALDVRRDLQYYVAMAVACIIARKAELRMDDVAALFPVVQKGIPDEVLKDAYTTTRDIYQQLGGDDKVSKGTGLVTGLRDNLHGRPWTS